jgi:hypothetical protein
MAPDPGRRRSASDHPRHPERVCWGCNRFCPAHDLACGGEKARAPHPVELFGDDWLAASDDRPRRETRDISM